MRDSDARLVFETSAPIGVVIVLFCLFLNGYLDGRQLVWGVTRLTSSDHPVASIDVLAGIVRGGEHVSTPVAILQGKVAYHALNGEVTVVDAFNAEPPAICNGPVLESHNSGLAR